MKNFIVITILALFAGVVSADYMKSGADYMHKESDADYMHKESDADYMHKESDADHMHKESDADHMHKESDADHMHKESDAYHMHKKSSTGYMKSGADYMHKKSSTGYMRSGADYMHKRKIVKDIVERAVFMAISEGKEQVLRAISDANGPFIDGDIYAFAGSLKKITTIAHPYRQDLIGKDLSLLNDGYGNYIAFEIFKVAKEKGSGWTQYWWNQPGSDKRLLKSTYVMKVPTKDYYIASGYYHAKRR